MRICKWEGLPDARDPNAPDGAKCSVVLFQQHLADIVQKHIAHQDGPWSEWLGPKLCEQLVQWLDGELQLGPEINQELCQRFQGQLEESLSRPLVVLHPLDKRNAAWVLVLPCGALALLRSNAHQIFVVSTYYLNRARLAPPHRRWLKTAHSLLWRYCDIERIGDTLQLVPSKNSHVRWVRLETWGFIVAGESIIWRGRLQPWPAAEKLSPLTQVCRIKLRKRKWTLPEDSDDIE